MTKTLQNRFALSEKGSKDLIKGIFFTTILNFALMTPASYLIWFLSEYLNLIFDKNTSINNDFKYYVFLAIISMAIMWIIAIFQYKSTFVSIYNESENRRISLAEKLRILPLAFFGEKNLSDLTSTIMSDSTDLEHTFSHAVPQLFASIISMSFIAFMMTFFNWKMALAIFWVVPLAAFIIMKSKSKQLKGHKDIYQIKREVSEKIQEGLETMQEMKSYNMESSYVHSLNSKLDFYEEKMIKEELFTGVMVNLSQSVLKFGIPSVVIVGSALLYSGEINILTFLIFLIVSTRIYEPIDQVLYNLAVLFYLDVRINRMKEMENMPAQLGRTEFNPVNFNIEFKDVHFSYDTGVKVLKGTSFNANQGEITALVGPSGSGKSTAAKIAARFWDIDSGEILLGGENIKNIDPEILLKYYSVVFQDVVLFNATIMDNIRIGRREASDEEIIRVAKLARCHDFIMGMSKGYNTVIGENGDTLSGGERQRISIARALLKNAPIVLLDEATASLDVENETKIQAGISELVKNKTVLIIAHRMRTVANADKIVVLENGLVSEIGTPQELQKTGGLFSRMMERQIGLY
jgi:ATP-binding cassette subfamily B protein IrtB